MRNSSDFLQDEYTIETPENVVFGYEIAGIGSRFIGALIDTFILVVALVALGLLLVVGLGLLGDLDQFFNGDSEPSNNWIAGAVIAAYLLLNFIIFWGYYIVFELIWNGQTPGKRVAGVRVIRTDGNAAGFVEIVIRNLVRIVDFLPNAYAIGVLVMFFNRQSRRLGDLAAGTLVIKERRDISLESLRAPVAADAPAVEPALVRDPGQARRLTAADYDLIQEALARSRTGGLDAALLVRLASALAGRLGTSTPPPDQARQFLEELADLYRHRGEPPAAAP
jgi:uncharacterized RDD family membrane protein YckC